MARPVKTYGGAATRAGSLQSRIPLIVTDLDDTMLRGVKEVAERIAEGARERVPDAHPLGEGLIDAIHVETEADLGVHLGISGMHGVSVVAVVAGDRDAWYGHIVENGSVTAAPHPFLIPAFEAERGNLERIIGAKLRTL